MKLEFSGQIFGKSTKTSNFIKISRVGIELFHADIQADMMKLTVAYRNFADAPKSISTGVYMNP